VPPRRPATRRAAALAARLLPRRLAAPAQVWTLVLAYLGGGVMLVLCAAFPLSDEAPTRVDAALGVACLVVAALLWLGGGRVPRGALHAAAAAGTLIVHLAVATSATNGGVLMAAFAYQWLALYAACAFSPRGLRLHLVHISAGFGAGLVAGGLPHVALEWCMVSVTVWGLGEVVATLAARQRELIERDALTGALNRAGFAAAAGRALRGADRTRTPVTVAIVDLDDFKSVNDRQGHAAGDRLLAGLVSAWSAQLRPSDLLGRQGGDEFVLLLADTDAAGSAVLLERLRAVSGTAWSAGVAHRLPGEDLESCLLRADRALYEEKPELRPRMTAAPAFA
jgi:diguanylate cyclase (GGDEF)-like protein